MRIDPLPPSDAPDALQVQRWAAMGLPVPPSWRVSRQAVQQASPTELNDALAGLVREGDSRYWVMHQGPVNQDSLRQNIVNLDSDAALAAALAQTFEQDGAPEEVVIQSLPARQAAGVLFSRHPMRPDLDHIVIEGVVEGQGNKKERLILQRTGELAWMRGGQRRLADDVGTRRFLALARLLWERFTAPQACEWIWDGHQLWLLQSLPVGSLPSPEEAWSRRMGMGIWTQAVSPLWYTLESRWLKVHFWRRLGRRLHWEHLDNIEPYRRLYSHIYSNARFFRQLYRLLPVEQLGVGIPPAWRDEEREEPAGAGRLLFSRANAWWVSLRLWRLERRLRRLRPPAEGAGADDYWHHLIRLDRIGEKLAALEGWLAYIEVPQQLTGDQPAALETLLGTEELALLRAVGRHDGEALRREFPGAGAGADPLLPRFSDGPGELAALGDIAAERRKVLISLEAIPSEGWQIRRRRARSLRYSLATALRRHLDAMARVLIRRKVLQRPEDVFFLYFDELWQAWNSRKGGIQPQRLHQRKVRYMSDAHQGAPDWVMDQVGYGINWEGRTHPLLRGRGLVAGRAEGRVRRLHSAWELSLVQPGDVLVLDQCDPGWLPWICLAGGLVLGHRDPLDPAAALARKLDIPAVWGIDDAMHCLPDDAGVSLDGESGEVTILSEPEGAEEDST